MKQVEFYFDFLSPYSYLSWNWVRKQFLESKFQFEFLPVVMSKIIHHYDTKGPAEIASKRNYLYRDCLRFAALNEIPFRTPTKLPFNSLYALRMSVAESVEDAGSDQYELQFKLIDAIFTSGWGNGLDIGDPDVLLQICRDAGLDGAKLLEAASGGEARSAVKKNIKRALSNGVFGVPTFIVDGELFWGNDSTPSLVRVLAGEDVLDRARSDRFEREFL